MKREYIAVLLAGFIAAMSASATSYIHTRDSVREQNYRLDSIETTLYEEVATHKQLYKDIKKTNEDNSKVLIELTRIATIIKIKLQED